MRKEDFVNALDHIDYDLVEEYVAEKEKSQKRAQNRNSAIRIVPLAACFILLFAIGTLFLNDGNKSMSPGGMKPSGDNGIFEGLPNFPSEDPEWSTDTDNNFAEDESNPFENIYVFTFKYNGREYVSRFVSSNPEDFSEEIYEKNVSVDYKGEHIATVVVKNHYNNTETTCSIYTYLSMTPEGAGNVDDKILIELYDGLYFVAEPCGNNN